MQGGYNMCKKWTEEEFQAKMEALEAKKRRKAKIKSGVDTIAGTLASSSIMIVLCKIAEKVY